MLKTALAAIAALACSTVLIAPHAAAEPVAVTIATGDLDLYSDAGRSELRQRANRAARAACGERSALDPRGSRLVRACRAEILAKALRVGRGERLATR